MKKRIICLLLSMLLLLAFFTGCSKEVATTAGESPATEASEPTETTAQDPVDAEPEEETPVDESPAEEAPNQEETPAAEEVPYTLPLTDEVVEYSLYTSVSPMIGNVSSLNLEDNMVLQELEKRTNVHLNIQNVSALSFTEQFMLMIAGGEWSDLINNVRTTYSGGLAAALNDDVIIDLAEYAEYMPNYMNIVTSDENLYRDVTLGGGEMGAFYGIFTENKPIDSGLLVRGDWLDKLGLDAPETVADYEEVARAFYTEYGATVHLPTNGLFANQAFLSAYEVAGFYIDAGFFTSLQCYTVENDKLICGFTQDGFKQYLQLVAGWYAEGLITSDYMSSTSTSNYLGDDSDAVGDLLNDRIGIWGDSVANQLKYDNTMSADPNFYAQPTELPTINADDDVVCGQYIARIDEAYFSITTTCENPELIIQWIDYAYTSEGSELYNWGLEGKTYVTNGDGFKEYTDLIMNNPDDLSSEQAKYFYLGFGSYQRDIEAWYAGYNDRQMACFDVWNKDFTGSKALSTQPAMTVEEGEAFSTISGDLITYLSEAVAKFIVGEKNFDKDYDEFIDNLYSFGVDELTEIQQNAYDRWAGIE